MFYVKNDNAEIPVEDLKIYSKCPVCKQEFELPEFWELLYDECLDLLDKNANVYCDACSKEYERIKKTMQTIHPDADELTIQHYSEAMQKRLHGGLTA